MKLRIMFLMLGFLSLVGCSTPLTVNNDYDKISAFEYDKDEIVDISYCTIVLPKFIRQGICVLAKNEIGIYWDQDLGNVKKNLLLRYEYKDIKKIAHATKMRLSQIQILGEKSYFSIQIAPNASFVDQEKTLEWFNFMSGEGVETFEPYAYMSGPIKRYQIIYQ